MVLTINTFTGTAWAKTSDSVNVMSEMTTTDNSSNSSNNSGTQIDDTKKDTVDETVKDDSKDMTKDDAKQDQGTSADSDKKSGEEKQDTKKSDEGTKKKEGKKKVKTQKAEAKEESNNDEDIPAIKKRQAVSESFRTMCKDIFGTEYADISSSTDYAEVYVGKNTGSEQTGELGSETKPYGSLKDTYTALAKADKKGAIVHLMESYSEVDEKLSSWPDESVPMIITSDAYDISYLSMDGNKWNFRDNIGFYDVQIKLNYAANTAATMFANGHTVVFGGYGENNFAFINENTSKNYPTLFGASSEESGTANSHSSVAKSCLKIYAGCWSQIFGGGEYYSDVKGEADVTVDGYIASTGKEGAVTFNKKNMAYMEGSAYIYGGGAGKLQSTPVSTDFSHCGSTVLSVRYVTMDKSITPNGGYVDSAAVLNLKNSTVRGTVHVYSEGCPAETVTLNVDSSTVSYIGCYGGDSAGVSKKYRIAREKNPRVVFNLNKAEVTESFTLRSGLLAQNKYNDLQGLDVKICDSTLDKFWLGTGGTTDSNLSAKKDEVFDSLWIENSTIKNRMNSFYGFYKIKDMTLIGMGTEANPLPIEKSTFGQWSNNCEIENLKLEKSAVSFADNYKIENLTISESSVQVNSDELNVTNYTSKGTGNKLNFKNNAFFNIYGNATGTSAQIDFSRLNEQDARAGVWKKGKASESESNLFTIKETDGVVTRHDFNSKMEYWYGYLGDKKTQNWIYVDGEAGSDDNDGKTISTPIKTMEKAVQMASASNGKIEKIVLCDAYHITTDKAYESAWLVPKGKGITDTLTVTMQDDMVNYGTMDSGIYMDYPEFTGSVAETYINLGSSFKFENIDFYNARAGQRPGIFCNGYDTFMEKDVNTIVSQASGKANGVISIYSGNAHDTESGSQLSVQSGAWGWIYIGGVDKSAQTGKRDSQDQTIALDVNASNSGIGLNGSVYGNIKIIDRNAQYLFCWNARSNPGTVYGNIDVEYKDTGSARFVAPCPEKVTVEGDVTFHAEGDKTNYNVFTVPNCTINGNLTIDIENANGTFDEGIGTGRGSYGCWLLSKNTKIGGKLDFTIKGMSCKKIGMASDNEWIKSGGVANFDFMNVDLKRIFATDQETYQLSGNSVAQNPYANYKNVTFNITDCKSQFSECQGMGKLILEQSTLDVNGNMEVAELEVKNQTYLKTNGETVIGNDKNGKLSIVKDSTLETKNNLLIDGDVCGDSEEATGTLINNNGDENGQVTDIEVTGTISGKTYYYTSFDKAKITVQGNSQGDEFQALPPDENGYKYTSIQADPTEEEGEKTGRSWEVTNLKSRKYVYVDGTYSSLSDEEYAKHDGTTPELAYKTIKEAYEVVHKKGYIVICGDTNIDKWPTNATQEVTITSKVEREDGSVQDFYSKEESKVTLVINSNLTLLNKTIFDNLNLKLPAEHTIKANGYQIVMGHAHDDKNSSLIVEGKNLNVWGVNGDQQRQTTAEANVTIYDGTYGKVTTYSYEQTYDVICKTGTLNIYGGSINEVYVHGGLCDRLSKDSVTNVYIENAEIRTGIYATHKPQYSQGTFNIKLGKNISFLDTSAVYLANLDYYSFANLSDENINFTIDNDGKSYKIPKIYCGSYYKGSTLDYNNRDQFITMDLSNIQVDSLYCGPSVNINFTSQKSKVVAKLGENTYIKNLYYGGSGNKSLPNVEVSIESNSAKIDHLCTTSVREDIVPTVSSKLVFKNVGTKEKPYDISANWELKGLTSFMADNSVIDVTELQDIDTKEMSLENKSILYSKSHSLNVTGDYISDETVEWDLANAPIISFGGTITGKTKLVSLSPDASAGGEVTGRFYNGISISAKHDDNHTKDRFVDYEGESSLNFEKKDDQDEWSLPDQDDTSERTQIYVSAIRGKDTNEGTYGRPVKTIEAAYQIAEKLYQDDNSKENLSIILLDDIVLSDDNMADLSPNYQVTISSYDNQNPSSLIMNEEHKKFVFPVDTKLKNVKIENKINSVRTELYADGHKLEIEDTVKTSATSGYYPVIYGGTSEAKELEKTQLIVNGGTWNAIYGGSNKAGSRVKQVHLTLGGKVDTQNIGTTSELTTGVFGGSSNGTVDNVAMTIDRGKYYRIFGGGDTENADITGDIRIDYNAGETMRLYGGGQYAQSGNIEVNIGSDTSASEKAVITNIYRGSGLYAGLADGKAAKTYVKNNASIASKDKDTKVQFAAGGYSGNTESTELYIEGGMIDSDIYAGGWGESEPGKYGNVNQTKINISGGTVNGNIYGGGNLGLTKQNAFINIEGGKITGNIYGGGNAAGTLASKLVIASDQKITGNVFGGSYNITNSVGDIQKTSDIQLKQCEIEGSVYGGSDTSGAIDTSAKVEACGKASVSNGIFGGGDKAALQGVTDVVVNQNASYTGNIFGGGKGELKTKNGFARVLLRIFTESDLIDAHATETNVTVNGSVTGDVFGGGEYATVGTTDENADQDTLDKTVSNVTINGTVNGKVYGGGKGEKDKNYAAVNGSTSVILGANGKVTVDGDAENAGTGVVFGGGQNAPVAGNTNVSVQNGTYSTIFGGNDVSGEIQGKTNVNVTGGEVAHIYGAGRDAAYTGTGANVTADSKANVSEIYGGGYGQGAKTDNANVSIRGGTVKTAYAGGNAAATKDTEISVTGGQTDTVFGGGNAATITGSSKVTVDTADDTQHVDTVFAGNNKAAMGIKPTLEFADGKIGTVYCGGNQGIMTYHLDTVGNNGGISYTFDYPKAEIGTVFAGCNNTSEQTEDVELTMVSGEYGTVYGGNNQTGNMEQTSVIVDASKEADKALSVDTIYGGGNQADAVNTSVNVKNGEVATVYGGGNAATVTDKVEVNATGDPATDKAQITDLYCGNNEAEMALQPVTELENATISHFYGGGNQGVMTKTDGLEYVFDSDNLTIDTIYGGGNEAGVTQSVTLNVAKGNYTNIYGGSNSKGTVDTANVNIKGNVGTSEKAGKVFGGGRGSSTVVNNTNVSLRSGTITGNVYGGSGFGSVGTANVSAQETAETVKVNGNIYGAGYGVSSSANDTNVNINLKLSIKKDGTGDVKVDETLKSDTDKSGESKATATWKNDYKNGSYISGNVFGGGDMGQVGKGYINTSTNTAVIEKSGKTTVNVGSGYIHGNIFGGGNGQPGGEDESGNAITEYTVYMGTVFGTSNVNMTGGYVNGNVFGCGQQSRTYSNKNASNVKISPDNTKPILIGGSIFGGGNKGNGTTQNASVATVYGDTHVTLQGMKNQYTQIYLLSNGTSGGGVYGDGNLCLVSGKKYVTLENFSCGVGANVNLLKTFYSLQRADVVDIIASRIVLKGAVDLVAENADDTVYSINRASQVNLKESSTIKVTKTVNLLGELTSDEQTGRQFIDRGNNNGNANITGNDYTGHGGKAPENPLTKDEVTSYINAYDKYSASGTTSGTYQSINVVCVANGGYLEVKKNSKDYGPVTGLFTLQLVNANPGEGGGFIYADIMGKQIGDKYVTGNFVCVTKQSESSNDYMYAYHNVGGQYEDNKYEYYVWYLKGNKYSYDVDLTSYIGTKDTEFTKTVSLATEPDAYSMILTQLNQTKDLSNMDLNKMYQNTWTSSDDGSDKFAVEVTLITKNRENSTITTSNKSIGYIGYQTTSDTNPKAAAKTDSNGKLVWGIWRSDGNGGWKFQACKGTNNSFTVEKGDALAQTDDSIVSAQMKFTLHKGTGMTTEFRNLPFEMIIAEAKTADYNTAVTGNSSIQEDSCIRLTTNLNLSAIRLVPTQAAYMGSGRMFAGVSSSSNVNITKTSAFTAQFVTKYIPSAFNTGSTNQIKETLTTKYDDIYLWDTNGVGYTIKENPDSKITVLNVVNSNDPDVKSYKVTKSGSDYSVSYLDASGNVMTDADGKDRIYDCKVKKQSSGFTLPKGTMITMLASLDEDNPTYWYYYCTKDTSEVQLEDFKEMNTSNEANSDRSVYDTIFTTSSSRVTENMIFVFDFEKVSDSDWSGVNAVEGNMQLKHTYKGGSYTSDIMDYVSAESKTNNGTTTTSYQREMPRQTETFKISKDSDGITNFGIRNADESNVYGQKEKMKFNLNITPDTNVTNTQYEEREYAVILTLRKKGETSEIAFPEGTTFTFNNEKLSAGKDNKYVIVPVKTVGTHEVEIQSKLAGFDADNYELVAKLYSTSEEGYYNSIKITTDESTHADFRIKADPTYALQVKEHSAEKNVREKNHFAKAGESFDFTVTAMKESGTETGESAAESDAVSVGLYRYDQGAYTNVALDFVLDGTPDLKNGQNQSWAPAVKSGAKEGTYRLEFTYHDKTEYWDFMVMP